MCLSGHSNTAMSAWKANEERLKAEKGAEREITIRFKGNENQNNVAISHTKLKIKFNSWDNVEIL